MTTKITPSVLENTAVVAATHGNGATIPVIVVDPQGRITGVTNTTVGIATSQITSGTLADARLPDQSSLSAAAYFGDAAKVPTFVTDAKGRIKSAANVTIAIASSAVSGLASSATTDTTNAGNISSGTLPNARLSDTGVVAATHGTASSVSQVVVDAKGRITGASNVAIQIATSQITSYPTFASSATTDTTNAGNISSGTLPTARLGDSGVVAGSYGTAAVHPTITVDAKGRVTAVTATSIAIAAGAVSGLATVATTGSYTDLSNRPSIPSGQVNSDWNASSGLAQILNKPSLATVATSGSYNDLSSKPTIPTSVSQLTSVTPDVQQFNSTGTWTKPTGGQTMARIMCWGGGGGGGGMGSGSGGGYNEQIVPLSWLSSTVTATVGAGGGGSAGLAGNGGSSSFALATGISGKTSVTAGGGFGGGQNYGSIPPYLWGGASGNNFYTDREPGYGGGRGADDYYGGGSGSAWGGTGGVGAYYNGYYTPGSGYQPGGGGAIANGVYAGGPGGAGRIIVMCW
jgi:hypothetical protein